jgi:hypothetical protein
MAEPFRLRVLQRLTDLLRTITPANGYAHDLSEAVFRGRDLFSSEDPLPMLSLLEAVDPLAPWKSPEGTSMLGGPWALLIQGFVADDPTNPTDPAHRLAADVRKLLAVEMQKRNGFGEIAPLGFSVDDGKNTVLAMTVGAPVVRPADDQVSSTAHFWLSVTLTLSESPDQPFA